MVSSVEKIILTHLPQDSWKKPAENQNFFEIGSNFFKSSRNVFFRVYWGFFLPGNRLEKVSGAKKIFLTYLSRITVHVTVIFEKIVFFHKYPGVGRSRKFFWPLKPVPIDSPVRKTHRISGK